MRPHPGFPVLIRIYTYLRPYRVSVIVGIAFMLGIDLISILIPQAVRITIDRGMRPGNLALLAAGAGAVLALALVKSIFTFFQGRIVETYSQGVAYDLRREIHSRLTGLSFSFHDTAENGQLLSRTIQDVERIRFLTGRASQRMVEGAILLAASATVMISMSPLLAFLSLLLMPILVWRAIRYGNLIRPLSYDIQQQLAVLTTRVEQNLRGARIVKAFAQERAEVERFRAENDRWFELSRLSSRIQAVNGPLLNVIANLSTVIVVGYGGYLIVNGTITIGLLVAFLTYLGQLSQPVRMMGQIAPVVGIAASSGDRIFEILDTESEVREPEQVRELPRIIGRVCFNNVHFAYRGREETLQNVTFAVEPGMTVALLGETGSGKTTIMNLIPRFYDVTSGSITIDGIDIRGVPLASLRDQVGIVMQEAVLFGTTIGENIRLGRPDASSEEVIAAATAAQAHEFIVEAGKGYDTPVGEMGATLSGGQKQRIAIARALLKDPRILLLDDATSSVDTQTERKIQKALALLLKGRTSFIIAHRLSTVRLADRIILMEGGRILAMGNHESLLESSDLYARICREQLYDEVMP
ncbi:MAG TPA: ABC transporter ATP-binding protein [Spirochaetia bacterium]|nr:ABC transporter ATP-binding protein [Spirochaetia bacterium]